MIATRTRRRTTQTEQEPQKTIRCAIYTRKSTEDGLEQEFNSLDAQRDSGEAYIESQKAEGWVCLPDRYDDGGFSGGNMDRPAVQRLMADVEAGKLDCIVVYKVDRLSRSLLDFARMMETLDRRKVSFVSVTQQFNTTHSMGRLTLNILLSFAQFEREIIAERTRDKMAAAKRKGKWVGGRPILGYDVDPKGGRLLVNPVEAQRVQAVFDLYLKHGALLATVRELNARGWTSKRWTTRKGHEQGGEPFTKNRLYRLLTSVLYVGKQTYRDEVHQGEQPAIVDADVWRQAQELLRRNGREGGHRQRNKYGALLRGLLVCEPCRSAMVHTFTAKGNRRYRYYVCSNAQQKGWAACPTKSVPAAEMERFVIEHLRRVGADGDLVARTVQEVGCQVREATDRLDAERRSLERELRGLHEEVKGVVGQGANDGARLASLEERIQQVERRATAVQEEMAGCRSKLVTEKEMVDALRRFDPIWESLKPPERARLVELLVERVGYNGADGTVAVTFRAAGIRAFAQEAADGSHHSK